MPQENTFDLQIAHTSPLFTATPFTGARATGWEPRCTADGYPCDGPDQSAVFTALSGATMQLTFWGSRIELRGNATGGMDLAWELDGSSRSPDSGATSLQYGDNAVGERLAGGLLGVFGGLDASREHTLRFTTKPSLGSAVVVFQGAVVTVGTGVAGGQMTKTYLDIDSPQLIYTDTPGGWARYNDYTSPSYNITLPPGVTNPQFESTKLPGSSVSLRFNGTQVLLYGPCYGSNGAYAITLDNQLVGTYNASLNAYSNLATKPAAASCLRYISPPLSPDQLHVVSMANNDDGRETNLDWALVVENSGGSAAGGSKGSSNIGAIVGAVVGSLALVLALVILFFVIRRRRRLAKKVTAASDSASDNKAVPLDLLSAQSDIPSLTSEHKANVLINPSHGSNASSGNGRVYRRIEPFELPPIVDGVRSHGKTPSAGTGVASSGERPVSSLPQDTSIEQSPPPVPMSVRTASPPPMTTTSQSVSSAPFSSVDPPLPQPHPFPQPQPQQQQQVPGQAAPDLSQISSDVNRILAQLGQIRRRADSNVREQLEEHEEETVPPPEYGKHRRV